MAKLKGVEVVDMKDGVPTKITYEGAEYSAVSDARIGDIGRRVKYGLPAVNIGGYYEIIQTPYPGDVGYIDNDGDLATAKYADNFAYFRKAADSPTLADRVSTLETRIDALTGVGEPESIYRKVSRKPVAGDYVKFTETSDSDITLGKYYEITRMDWDGDPEFIDDAGEGNVGIPDESFDIYVKDVGKCAEIKTEKRHAKAGERILITDAWADSDQKYVNGDILKVREEDAIDSGDVRVEGEETYVDYSEYEVVVEKVAEVIEKDTPVVEEMFVGKYVVFSDTRRANLTEGKSYEIIEEDCEGFRVKDDVGDEQYAYDKSHGSQFTYVIHDEKPKAIEGAPQVGDKIRVVAAHLNSGRYKNGDELTVASVGAGRLPEGIYVEEHPRLLWREEFEIIERPETNGFKVGDYAKIIKSMRGNEGKIVEVVEPRRGYNAYEGNIVNRIVGTDFYSQAHPTALIPATDEEVTEAKAHAKRIASFAKAGRELDEFKTGDVVRVLEDRTQGSRNMKGDIGEVREVNSRGTSAYVYVIARDTQGANGGWDVRRTLELITPVESRVDAHDYDD